MNRSEIIEYLKNKDIILKSHYDKIFGFKYYMDNDNLLIKTVAYPNHVFSEAYKGDSINDDRISTILKNKEKMRDEINEEYLNELIRLENDEKIIDRTFTCLEILDEKLYEIVSDSLIEKLPIKVIEKKRKITKPTVIKRREKGIDEITNLFNSDFSLTELKVMAVEKIGKRNRIK